MNWVKADPSDFRGNLPQARSGHTAVNVGKSKVVVFGGFADRKFLADISVYDIENKLWFAPECTGNGSDGQAGPSPRAFHVAIAIDCHMFIFGGRSGSRRLGDFWMLDTDIWQWLELTSFGDLPSPREFAAAAAIGNRKIVMYGGWDGKKWLSDVYILDTISLEWIELSISGSVPPPRCGHTATMVEKRLLVFGGRGGGGPIMGDLWALKGLFEEENEAPGWTQLKLPGQSPSPRCGHSVTSSGHYLLLFGGHGTGGWLSRYDVYHNDCIILDRVSVQWKRLPTNNEPPPPRAYHSMTSIGMHYLLFGGFDGKTTFDDLWWLVPEGYNMYAAAREGVLELEVYGWTGDKKPASHSIDDPIAKQLHPISNILPETKLAAVAMEDNIVESPINDLQKRIGISVSSSKAQANFVDELDDEDLLELSSNLAGETLPISDQSVCIEALREHWKNSTATSIQLRELGPLLRDYQRFITHHRLRSFVSGSSSTISDDPRQELHRFFHLKSASQLRMDDVPKLLNEYQQLLRSKS